MAFSDILTTKEAADFLKVSQSAVKNWIRSGKLLAMKLPGGQYRITRDALFASLRASDEVENIFKRGSVQAKKEGITEEKIQKVFEKIRSKG